MKDLRTLPIVLISLIVFIGCAGMHYGTGMGHLKQQNYKDAIDSFNTVLEKNPEYPRAHTQLGIAYYKTEMYEQAISELQTAKKLRNRDKRARLFLGMAYLRHGKIDDTINEWDSYLEMFPSSNVSELLRKGIVALKSSDILPETVDLMTGSIETVIAIEDMVRNIALRHRLLHNEAFFHRGFFHRGFFPCD